jgi:hypothetical protein
MTSSGFGGVGRGRVSYSVLSNSGAVRSGTISVAGQTFTVRQGANFADVDPNSVFFDFIGKLSASGITVGCGQNAQGQLLYCPSQEVSREEMAALMIRALGMPNPPPPAQQRFLDVFGSSVFYAFIDQMAVRGITVGCNPPTSNLYCPGDSVTREQMAAFIIRALSVPNPPEPTMPRFSDVPSTNIFYGFIDQLALRQITIGCGHDINGEPIFCPGDRVTREQMAAFLVRAFGL